MVLSERVLGTRTAVTLRERATAPLLVIGSDVFTREDLSALKCFSDRAAANLSNRIKSLKVKNTRDLFANVAPTTLAVPGLGSFSVAVLGAAFEREAIGTLDEWERKHLPKGADVVTFDSLKHREARENAEERKRLKARQHARRNTAHRYRVSRFDQRRAS